jgi:hypothetical protein
VLWFSTLRGGAEMGEVLDIFNLWSLAVGLWYVGWVDNSEYYGLLELELSIV